MSNELKKFINIIVDDVNEKKLKNGGKTSTIKYSRSWCQQKCNRNGFNFDPEQRQWIENIATSIEYTHYHYGGQFCEESVFIIDPKHKLFSTMKDNIETIQRIRNVIDKGISFIPNDYTDTNMNDIIQEIGKIIKKD